MSSAHKNSQKSQKQIKVWQLYAIVGVLFTCLIAVTAVSYLEQSQTDQLFQNLVRTSTPTEPAEIQKTSTLGVSSEICTPCLKKELNNQIATYSAQSILLGELTSGEIFASKEANTILPIASLTKIMTAAIVLNELPLDKLLNVSPHCAAIPHDTQQLGLAQGTNMKVEDLLGGLLIRSGADCACVLGEALGGEEEMVKLMNSKSESMGLKSTHFQNSVGNDAVDNFSSAYDLLLLTKELMKNLEFRKLVGNNYFNGVTNTNELLFTKEGVTGVKTGNTPGAGECLVATWVRGDQEYIGVLLGSNDRFGEMEKLMEIASTLSK